MNFKEFERKVCIVCLLWQKKYAEVGKQIAEEDTYI